MNGGDHTWHEARDATEGTSVSQLPSLSRGASASSPAGYGFFGPSPARPTDEEDVIRRHDRRTFRCGVLRHALLVAAMLGFIGSITGLSLKDGLVHARIREATSLVNANSIFYDGWVNSENVGVPIYRRYYLYNVTNPFAVLQGHAPALRELGPFTYLVNTQKYDVRWYPNGTVGYRYKHLMTFVPEMSSDDLTGEPLSESMSLVQSNPTLRGLLYRVGRLPAVRTLIDAVFPYKLHEDACAVVQFLVNNSVYGPKGYFTNRTVKELLWGYFDPLWLEANPEISILDYEASTFFQMQWNGSVNVPSPYTYRRGMKCPIWEHPSQCNSSGNGITVEETGKRDNILLPPSQTGGVNDPSMWLPLAPGAGWPPAEEAPPQSVVNAIEPDPSNPGNIRSYANQPAAWWWGPMIQGITGGFQNRSSADFPNTVYAEETVPPPPENLEGPQSCRRLSGSDGIRFAPFLKGSDELELFVDVTGRSFRLAPTGPAGTTEGLPTQAYRFAPSVMDATPYNRYCYGQRFRGIFNFSRFLFGPGIGAKSMFLDSCFWDSESAIPGDPNDARRCTDPDWPGADDRPAYETDAGISGKHIRLNLSFVVPPEATLAQVQHIRGKTVPMSEYMQAISKGDLKATYDSVLHVQPETGVTVQGEADVTISYTLGPLVAPGCGLSLHVDEFDSFLWRDLFHEPLGPNDTVTFSPNSLNMTETVLPLLRFQKVAKLEGTELHRLQNALRLVRVVGVLLWVALGGSVALLLAWGFAWGWNLHRLSKQDQTSPFPSVASGLLSDE